MLAAGLHQAPHNARVDLEEVIAGHAGLAGHASRDDHNMRSLESLAQLVLACTNRKMGSRSNVGKDQHNVWFPAHNNSSPASCLDSRQCGAACLQLPGSRRLHLLQHLPSVAEQSALSFRHARTRVAFDLGPGVDVADICCHAGRARNIVQGQLADIRGQLQAQRKEEQERRERVCVICAVALRGTASRVDGKQG